MDYVELYFNQVVGCYPFDTNENKIKTENTINYLIDAEISEQDIIKVIEEAPAENCCLSPDILPEWLWDNSLLNKGVFYYHNILHIKSKMPTFNPKENKEILTKHFLEMKIRFTMSDLINYFYNTLKIDKMLMDIKKDSGAFEYLLNKYKRFYFIEPIDFVLAEIDYAKDMMDDYKIREVIALDQYQGEVMEMLRAKIAEASFAKANQIIWR